MKYRMSLVMILFVCICPVLIFFSCSSAPKTADPQAAVDIKNQAAEYAKYGDSYFAIAQYDQALKFFELALKENISVNNEEGIIKTYNSIGKVYSALNQTDIAASFFSQALELALSLENPLLISQSENNIGEIYLRGGNSEQALALFENAIDRLEDFDFPKKKKKKTAPEEKDHRPILYHNAGLTYKQQKDMDKALEFLNRALVLNTENNAYKNMADNYYAIASVYSKENTYEKALSAALSALEFDKKSENSLGIAKDFYALAVISEKSGNIKDSYSYQKNSYLVYKTLNLKKDMKKLLNYIISTAKKLDMDDDIYRYSTILNSLGE